MYYLVKTEEKDFSDFEVRKTFNDAGEFYEFVDNNYIFEKKEFTETITKGLELYGGVIELKGNLKLVNPSYDSEQSPNHNLEEFKHLIRDNVIDTIINE